MKLFKNLSPLSKWVLPVLLISPFVQADLDPTIVKGVNSSDYYAIKANLQAIGEYYANNNISIERDSVKQLGAVYSRVDQLSNSPFKEDAARALEMIEAQLMTLVKRRYVPSMEFATDVITRSGAISADLKNQLLQDMDPLYKDYFWQWVPNMARALAATTLAHSPEVQVAFVRALGRIQPEVQKVVFTELSKLRSISPEGMRALVRVVKTGSSVSDSFWKPPYAVRLVQQFGLSDPSLIADLQASIKAKDTYGREYDRKDVIWLLKKLGQDQNSGKGLRCQYLF